MSDNEQDFAAWREENHNRAQAHAVGWAERATTEYGTAVRYEDSARARTDVGWQHDRAVEERQLAQFHGVRSTEARILAEMWATVAKALDARPADFELVGDS